MYIYVICMYMFICYYNIYITYVYVRSKLEDLLKTSCECMRNLYIYIYTHICAYVCITYTLYICRCVRNWRIY